MSNSLLAPFANWGPAPPDNQEIMPTLGDRIPLRPRPLLAFFARHLLRFFGWRFDLNGLPNTAKMVIIGGPHTSNWDGIFAISTTLAAQVDFGMLVKHSAFKPPFGAILRWFGAIAIDRSAPGGFVAEAVRQCGQREHFLIGISPEGTRGPAPIWKRGFYQIALGAEVPIACAFFDYRRKLVGIGPVIHPSGDYAADLEKIQAFYRTITPRIAKNFVADG